MTARWKLFYSRDMYDLPGTEALFLKSMGECCAYHAAHCPEYAAILAGAGFAPGDLRTRRILPACRPYPRCTSSATPFSPCPGGACP